MEMNIHFNFLYAVPRKYNLIKLLFLIENMPNSHLYQHIRGDSLPQALPKILNVFLLLFLFLKIFYLLTWCPWRALHVVAAFINPARCVWPGPAACSAVQCSAMVVLQRSGNTIYLLGLCRDGTRHPPAGHQRSINRVRGAAVSHHRDLR